MKLTPWFARPLAPPTDYLLPVVVVGTVVVAVVTGGVVEVVMVAVMVVLRSASLPLS